MRNMPIKQMLTQPIVVCSVLITCLWIVADIDKRLFNQSKQSVQVVKTKTSIELAKMQLNTREYEFITQQFEHFKQEQNTAPKEQAQLSAEQQLAQQGLMQQVFVNNNKLRLKAVVTQQATANKKQAAVAYALINITDQKTSETKLLKVINSQQIEGFTMTISSNTQVELTRSIPQGEQHISLTMYRVADKIKQ
jgi:hypothetical protein